MTPETDLMTAPLLSSESCAAVYGDCLAAQVCPPQTLPASMHAPRMLGASRRNGASLSEVKRGEFLAERLTGLGGLRHWSHPRTVAIQNAR